MKDKQSEFNLASFAFERVGFSDRETEFYSRNSKIFTGLFGRRE